MKYILIILLVFCVTSSCSRSIWHSTPNTSNTSYSSPYDKYKYHGTGQYTQLERVYDPVFAKTFGYMISMKEFVPKTNIALPYFLEVLPDQIEILHIDLALTLPNEELTREQKDLVLKNIPESHRIRCTLWYSDTREIITSNEMPAKLFPRMNNRKLRRNYILNLLEVEPNTIRNGQAVEIKLEYFIDNKPIDNKMMLTRHRWLCLPPTCHCQLPRSSNTTVPGGKSRLVSKS